VAIAAMIFEVVMAAEWIGNRELLQ
jgi:hypothetical protein